MAGRQAPDASPNSSNDCMGCRITGGLFGVGGAGYMASHLLSDPPPKGSHRISIMIAASTIFAMGMYRAFAP